MKNKISIILLSLMLTVSLDVISQTTYEQGKIWIIVHDTTIIPKDGGQSSSNEFQQILGNFNVTNITQPMSFAKTPELQRLYELNTNLSEDSLFNELTKIDSLFLSIEKCPKAENLYDPADYWWSGSTSNYLWYLEIIDAPLAWDITKGNSNVKVAVLDSGVDPNHPDLIGKISPNYDYDDGTPFTTVVGNQIHGTSVATLLAAETVDQGQTPNGQMASIGYNTQIMFTDNRTLDACLRASTVFNADIISISWFYQCSNPSTSMLLVEKEILDNGTCIIRAAGNGVQHCNGYKLYPFSGYEDDRTIVISSTGKDDKHIATDLLPDHISNSHYPEVDLCAPGYTLLCGNTTNNGQNNWPYSTAGGTSQSTPIVSGTVALMYSVNSCLTPGWVQDILINTTDPIVDASSYPGVVGSGRLNAHQAVKAAQNSYSTSLDLYIKDRLEDFGDEANYPYHWAADRDDSPDIWVRNQADGLLNQTHQEPEYQASQPVYVYVKVRNKSCVTSLGNEVINLYWSKASSASSWPQNWDGSSPNIGDLIGTVTIPTLEPGQETILEFTWNILNPYVHQNWASCLLARIGNSSTDQITPYPNELGEEIFFNNNVSLKNVTVIDILPGKIDPIGYIDNIYYPHGKYIFIGNPYQTVDTFNFTFNTNPSDSLLHYAETKLIFDDEGWQIVKEKFYDNPDFRVVKPKEVFILNDKAVINNLIFPAEKRIPVFVGFNFYGDIQNNDKQYVYHVRQYSSQSNNIIGGEHFVINKSLRPPFDANAGNDREINFGENITINAQQISELAVYNWYDSNDSLIYSGNDLTVSPDVTKKYKLELIATSDGSIAYDEVEVKVKKNRIENLSPNPATSHISVDYVLDGVTSSYIMIINQTVTISNNYIIDTNLNNTIINLNNYQTGIYTVILICDGVATDAKTLVVN